MTEFISTIMIAMVHVPHLTVGVIEDKSPQKHDTHVQDAARQAIREWLQPNLQDILELTDPATFGEAALEPVLEILAHPDKIPAHPDGIPALPDEILAPSEDDQSTRVALTLSILTRLARKGVEIPACRARLDTFLLSKDSSVRFHAVRVMAEIGGESEVPALVSMLYDPDRAVRNEAIRAIGGIGRESGTSPLKIWLVRTQEADEARPPSEKWLSALELRHVNNSIEALQAKVDEARESER